MQKETDRCKCCHWPIHFILAGENIIVLRITILWVVIACMQPPCLPSYISKRSTNARYSLCVVITKTSKLVMRTNQQYAIKKKKRGLCPKSIDAM